MANNNANFELTNQNTKNQKTPEPISVKTVKKTQIIKIQMAPKTLPKAAKPAKPLANFELALKLFENVTNPFAGVFTTSPPVKPTPPPPPQKVYVVKKLEPTVKIVKRVVAKPITPVDIPLPPPVALGPPPPCIFKLAQQKAPEIDDWTRGNPNQEPEKPKKMSSTIYAGGGSAVGRFVMPKEEETNFKIGRTKSKKSRSKSKSGISKNKKKKKKKGKRVRKVESKIRKGRDKVPRNNEQNNLKNEKELEKKEEKKDDDEVKSIGSVGSVGSIDSVTSTDDEEKPEPLIPGTFRGTQMISAPSPPTPLRELIIPTLPKTPAKTPAAQPKVPAVQPVQTPKPRSPSTITPNPAAGVEIEEKEKEKEKPPVEEEVVKHKLEMKSDSEKTPPTDKLAPEVQMIIDAQYKFMFNVFEKFELINDDPTDQNKSDNFMFSPHCLHLTLSALLSIAKDKTQTCLSSLLCISNENTANVAKGYEMLTKITQQSTFDDVLIGNALITKKEIPLQENITQKIKTNFNADLLQESFKDNTSMGRINEWASKRTNLKIKEIIKSDFEADVKLVVLNSIYMKAFWNTAYETKETKNIPFYNPDQSMGSIDVMIKQKRVRMHNSPHGQMLFLPYHRKSLVLALFLPDEILFTKCGNSFGKLFKKIGVSEFMKMCRVKSKTLLEFTVPKSTFISKPPSLKELLSKMGGEELFQEGDFSALFTEKSSISDVFHTAILEISEEGTIQKRPAGCPAGCTEEPMLMFDRPYFFMVFHRKTKLPLYSGMINKM